MADQTLLPRRSAFAQHVAALPAGPGDVAVGERTGLGIATLMARGGGTARLAEQVAELGVALPDGPRALVAGDVTIVGTGAGTWLLLSAGAGSCWAADLAHAYRDVASVADQSSGYAVLRLSGEGARALLSRGAFLDFHPDMFAPGAAAVTLIAHMGVILWQRDAAPTFEIALFRSLAESFWHWLESAAAGAGLSLVRLP